MLTTEHQQAISPECISEEIPACPCRLYAIRVYLKIVQRPPITVVETARFLKDAGPADGGFVSSRTGLVYRSES